MAGKTLCIFLTDPLSVLYEKGEIKERYYNPAGFFTDVHMISFTDAEIDAEKVRVTVGNARLHIHCVGRRSIRMAWGVFFGCDRRVLDLVRSIHPDCVRAYDISLSGALACQCARVLGIPSVCSIHGNFTDQRRYDKRPILHARRLFERYALSMCDMLICISRALKEYAVSRGRPDAVVIYEGINIRQFSPAKTARPLSQTLSLLCVSRLARPKNPECIVRAIAGLDVRLVLIGDGEYDSRLRALARELNIEHKIEFIKSVPNSRIHEYYHRADIFVLSTFYEGLCIPVIEAMAAGVPVVASDIPVIREVLGDCGVLSGNTVDAFRSNIQRLMNDPSLRSTYSAAALQRVSRFDFAVSEDQEAAAYAKLVRGMQ